MMVLMVLMVFSSCAELQVAERESRSDVLFDHARSKNFALQAPPGGTYHALMVLLMVMRVVG